MTALLKLPQFAGYAILELLRQPTYVLTTLIFPSMFFWFFGVPNAQDPDSARMLMGSFAAFAVLGVVLFQLTVAVAQDRAGHWSLYLRSLPVPSWVFLAAQIVASFVLALMAVGLVVLTAVLATEPQMNVRQFVEFFAWVMLCGFPFASLGLVLGSLTDPKSAVPVGNLVYLPLSFAGGLWIPPNALSAGVQTISEYLPTRFYGEVIWALVRGETPNERWIYGLLAYSVVFFAAAIYLHRRDLGARFG